MSQLKLVQKEYGYFEVESWVSDRYLTCIRTFFKIFEVLSFAENKVDFRTPTLCVIFMA